MIRHKYSSSEYDLMPKFEQISKLDLASDVRTRREYPMPVSKTETHLSEEYHKNSTTEEEGEVFQREDHVTQHLSDMLVNTDSEITGLQASEVEEVKEEPAVAKEDTYFSYLTGQERDVQVEWLLAGADRKLLLDSNDVIC